MSNSADPRRAEVRYSPAMAAQHNPFLSAALAVRDWTTARPRYTDVGMALVAGALSIADIGGADLAPQRDLDLVGSLLVCFAAASLIWRRIMPIGTLLVVTLSLGIFYWRNYGALLAAVGLYAMYSAVAHANNRRRAWVLVILTACSLLVLAFFTVFDDTEASKLANSTSMGMSLVCAMAGGGVVRNRNEIFLSAQQRAESAEADRVADAKRAVAQERLRIAREMHDVVAHGMSVITVQATAAQAIAGTNTKQTVQILQNIETTGRESLSEMRRMLGVLRSEDTPLQESGAEELAPQPTIRDLDSLIESYVAAGTPTQLNIVGTPQPMGPGLELAAYRIVQEALTNVIKHAGRTATATVRVSYDPSHLTLHIADSGSGALSNLAPSRPGNGLIGMRERVEAYSGTFSAAPKRGGGFEVRATLPVSERPTISSVQTNGQIE